MERDPSSVSRDEVPFSHNISAVAAFACRPGQYDDVIEGRQAGDMYNSILNKLMAASRCFFVMSSASRIRGICDYRGSLWTINPCLVLGFETRSCAGTGSDNCWYENTWVWL